MNRIWMFIFIISCSTYRFKILGLVFSYFYNPEDFAENSVICEGFMWRQLLVYICESCLITGHRYLLMWREFPRLLFLLRIGGDPRRRRYCLCWLLRYRLWSSSRTGTGFMFIVSNHRGQTSFNHAANLTFVAVFPTFLRQRPFVWLYFK